MVELKEYCHCYDGILLGSEKTEGKIVGCHLTADLISGCGGYITDLMLKRIKERRP